MLVKAPPLKLYVYGADVPAVTFMVTVPDTFAFEATTEWYYNSCC
jgi:hypothetical protein